jgi:hypothetical protein
VVKEVRLTSRDGSVRAWREDVRMYAQAEIAALLAVHGFEVQLVHGDFDGSAYGSSARRQIVHARLRERASHAR